MFQQASLASTHPSCQTLAAMRVVAIGSVPVSILSGVGFAGVHVEYWTQSGACSPCKPEYFGYSIALGLVFFVSNLLVWGHTTPAEPWQPEALRVRLRLISQRTLIALLASLAASLVLIGLAALPIVAGAAAVAYAWTFAVWRLGNNGS